MQREGERERGRGGREIERDGERERWGEKEKEREREGGRRGIWKKTKEITRLPNYAPLHGLTS